MQLRPFAEKVIQIALEAGAAILDIYHKESNWEIELKSDDSPLTLADRRANALICAGLQRLTPEIPIISEENKSISFAERQHYSYCWMVDPLDGTKEFIKRNGEFTVNIALIRNGSPVLGIVHIPVSEGTFWAVMGEGAHWTHGERHQPLHAADFDPKSPHLKVVASRSHLNAETEAFIAQFDHPSLVSRGSSLKFMLLAEGEAHVYPRLAPTMEWDTAAAQIILEEAGGSVVDFETQQPLRYNKPDLLNPHFVAYGKRS
jgi:3'(2'), 5'-bisphosphate nucleotidase